MACALANFRVLDLSTGPVGGRATMLLADFGADVVKLEPPGGDRFRALPSSALWLRGKRSAVVDLSTDEGRATLRRLAPRFDVVVTSGPPDRAGRLGADWDTLSAAHADVIACHVSGWGESGPLSRIPGYEGLVAARSGRMQGFAGQTDREGPVFAALPVATHAASQGAVHGILAALLARERGGRGQRVETSLLRGLLPYDLAALLLVQLTQRWPGAPDPKLVGAGMPTLNYHPVMAADGRWIQLGNLLEHLLFAFLEATELLPGLLADERFHSPPARWSPEAVEVARDRILTRMRERKADEWMEIFRAHGNVAAEPILSAREALEHPDLVAGGGIVEIDSPELGRVKQLGVLVRLGATPGRPGGAVPSIGQHTHEVLSEGRFPRRPRARATRPPPPGRPLAGTTVLEVATIIAAPLATSMLADLGARVIKVEAVGGDPYRHLLPRGLLAVKTNAGKQSIAIDLKTDSGQEILRGLVARADVLVHNFRPGVPERLGIGYDQTRALRPGIVWLAATGYGPDAPGARRPCAHPVAGASMGGVAFQAGAGMPPSDCETIEEIRDAARRLMRANEANPDPNTSVAIVTAVLLGLWVRERDGIGQPIFVDMLTANAHANADDMLDYAGKPPRPTVDAGLHGLSADYRLYRARQGWVFLAVPSQAEWERFARSAAPVLADDDRFATADLRSRHEADLTRALEAVFAEADADEWERRAVAAGVGCVRADVQAGEFLAHDPQSRAEDLAPEVDHARFGATRRWGALVRCAGGSDALGPGVLAGEHTDALLAELGYAPQRIRELRDRGVVFTEPIAPLGDTRGTLRDPA